ncbi:hypothetical protein HETIRDRAFT_482211 [Heterobasidion irregulare TC 32-1]|uniref:F-box domain-containing protein n=1 Tax=Heterobasidion irregulare (strain TC 32-1) TaxID=747525 RepID=W4JPK9_HETIT|nr:uncharacterized protein HETIRDRAFT_482211 [Heterobasidion irregulare TC 32-1]ETW75473.1 hypothetical protein HETIRDRAFT_482211 [Heterobasidion irregulare TC 32-1]
MGKTKAFPAEVLSLIFLHCTPPESHAVHPSTAPLVLTKVARRWRHVARSTPCLWSALTLPDAPRDPAALEAFFDALASWLALSRSTLLSIVLATSDTRADVLLRYLGILFPHSQRFRALRIEVAHDLDVLPSVPHDALPVVQDLDVSSLVVLLDSLILPRLRSLRLSSFLMPGDIHLHLALRRLSTHCFASLHTLTLCEVPIEDGRLSEGLEGLAALVSLALDQMYIGTRFCAALSYVFAPDGTLVAGQNTRLAHMYLNCGAATDLAAYHTALADMVVSRCCVPPGARAARLEAFCLPGGYAPRLRVSGTKRKQGAPKQEARIHRCCKDSGLVYRTKCLTSCECESRALIPLVRDVDGSLTLASRVQSSRGHRDLNSGPIVPLPVKSRDVDILTYVNRFSYYSHKCLSCISPHTYNIASIGIIVSLAVSILIRTCSTNSLI